MWNLDHPELNMNSSNVLKKNPTHLRLLFTVDSGPVYMTMFSGQNANL